MERLKFFERFVLIAVSGFTVLFVLFLLIAQWPEWWKWMVTEQAPIGWLEFTLLYTCGLLAAGSTLFVFIARRAKWEVLFSALLSIGFLYLSLDERFAVHERLRDKILAPMQLKLPILSWTAAGDIILLVFLICGLALLPRFLRLFRERKAAYYCFIVGVVLSALAVLSDSVDVHAMSLMVQRWEQCIEEIVETSGMLFYFYASFLRLTDFIGKTMFSSIKM